MNLTYLILYQSIICKRRREYIIFLLSCYCRLELELERDKRERDARERELRERELRDMELREKMKQELEMKPPGPHRSIDSCSKRYPDLVYGISYP